MSYTDYLKDTYDCGRFELLCKIKGENCTNVYENRQKYSDTKNKLDLRGVDPDNFDAFSYDNDNQGAFCGATIINDR